MENKSTVRSYFTLRRKEKLPSNVEEENVKVHELRVVIGKLSDRLEKFCTDECLHRYLRARNWNIKKAEKMLRDTLKWRDEYKPEEIQWEQVAHESVTAKLYRTSYFDKHRNTILVLAPGRQNTTGHDGQIRHLVYCLENAIFSLPSGQEQMVWLLDFKGYSLRNAPPFKTSLETLNILQNHYPERLALAILYNAPQIFEASWTMIRPFIDAKTVKKVKFVNSKTNAGRKIIEEVFDVKTLEKAYGGESDLQYDHEEYGKLRKEDDKKAAAFWGFQLKEIAEIKSPELTQPISPVSDEENGVFEGNVDMDGEVSSESFHGEKHD